MEEATDAIELMSCIQNGHSDSGKQVWDVVDQGDLFLNKVGPAHKKRIKESLREAKRTVDKITQVLKEVMETER